MVEGKGRPRDRPNRAASIRRPSLRKAKKGVRALAIELTAAQEHCAPPPCRRPRLGRRLLSVHGGPRRQPPRVALAAARLGRRRGAGGLAPARRVAGALYDPALRPVCGRRVRAAAVGDRGGGRRREAARPRPGGGRRRPRPLRRPSDLLRPALWRPGKGGRPGRRHGVEGVLHARLRGLAPADARAVLFDGRNLYGPKAPAAHGFVCYSVGRQTVGQE